MQILTKNKKAYFDYHIEDKLEVGIILQGWEVKSAKTGLFFLEGAYVVVRDNELFLQSARIKPWKFSPIEPAEIQNRVRKLLANKREIRKLEQTAKQVGFTLIPLEVYVNNAGKIKVLVGVGKGKKKYDKRNKLKDKDLKRRIKQDRKQLGI